MASRSEIRKANRERVTQYRDRQAEKGLVRLELYLDTRVVEAVHDVATELGWPLYQTMAGLIITGLRAKGRMPPKS